MHHLLSIVFSSIFIIGLCMGQNCTDTDPMKCLECNTDTGQCDTCSGGYWGDTCTLTCIQGCIRCDVKEGGCFFCESTDVECEVVCTVGRCVDFNCNSSKSTDMCDDQCNVLSNCEESFCDHLGARCSSCTNQTWGHTCNETCPEHCATCDIQKGCVACETGFFHSGSECHACSENCLDGLCNGTDGTCLSGCVKGNHGNDCQTTCDIDCPAGCDQFLGQCTGCSNTDWGIYCKYSCPPGCDLDHGCDQLSGTCHMCKQSTFGALCDRDCSEMCAGVQCNRLTGHCEACPNGYWGNLCNTACLGECYSNKCEKDTGTCSLDCKPGYHGLYCNMTCLERCSWECDRFTGQCNGCATGFHGVTCQNKCSDECATSQCDIYTGSCYGCLDGTWGDTCESNCSEACTSCLQRDGRCTSCETLCLNVTSGLCIICELPPVTERLQAEETFETLDYETILLTVGISVVLSAVLVIITACLLSRRRSDKATQSSFEAPQKVLQVRSENAKTQDTNNGGPAMPSDYYNIGDTTRTAERKTESLRVSQVAKDETKTESYYINSVHEENYINETSARRPSEESGPTYEELDYLDDRPAYYTQIRK